ncbi:DNA-3-methyladenine glycosylase [Kribbella qitaiheensis]|uniref:Putative 3-methyladenine DNA glycosylase n=1 Tax=Kribbella qitaiheensis TaxID=1544730 RepID=A0A7G6WV70_9ACTN|nr:DNA-3-methyladenine glycosylase [Kribbella qitaiheensis]QNE17885.1 DNA-3-methyladenine glycosylase [Kribbella qitaiheensis]
MPVRRTSLARPVLEVAPALLGLVLRRTTDEGTVAVRITEVEAYDGPNDPGSHSYRGQTARNAVMFGPPGYLYVYFTYGMHFCMNISAGPPGQPSAVLFRAGEIVEGLDLARTRRGAGRTGKPIPDRDLARGPARLCVALGINREENGADLLSRTSPIQLLPGTPFTGDPLTGPRVGLREAADRPWRFWIPGDPSVSPYKPHVPKRRQAGASPS